MTLLSALTLVILMPVLCLGPGWFFVRKLKWSPSEKLCASIGLSIVLIYLTSTAIYLQNLSWTWCWLTSVLGIALPAFAWRDLWDFISRRSIRRQIACYGLLLLIGLLMLSLIQHYSGAEWSGDWYEHYQRAIFFLERQPHDTMFINVYPLPARPPLMNLVETYFLALSGTGYDVFQVASAFLNLLVFFACVLLANSLVRYGSRKIALLTALFALNPMLWENVTWTWTKLLCAFFVIVSLAFYLRAWRKNDPLRMVVAAASMAVGLLTHYSAGPYAVALAVHYCVIAYSRRRIWLEMSAGASVVAILLATWFAWALLFYGRTTTFGSNTTATEMQHLSAGENLETIGRNFIATVVPHPLLFSSRWLSLRLPQPNPFTRVRDYFFVMYQMNLTMAWGLFGIVAVVLLARRQLSAASIQIRLFWLLFVTISILLGIAVHGPLEVLGVAHVCLQPIILIGLTLLGGGLHLLARWARCTLIAAAALDAVLGIILQIRMQMQWFRLLEGDGDPIVPFHAALPTVSAVRNSMVRLGLQVPYLSDHFLVVRLGLYALMIALFACLVYWLAATARSGSIFRTAILALFIAGAGLCSMDTAMGYNGSWQVRPKPTPVEPLKQAAAATPDSPAAHFQLGLAYYNLGQMDPAEDQWLDAFLLDPFDPQPRYALALLLGTHGRLPRDTNMAVPERFVENPDDIIAQLELAQMLADRGHLLPAFRRFRETAMQHPDAPEVKKAFQNMNSDLETVNRYIRAMEAQKH